MADTLKRLAGPANVASGTSTLFTGVAAHVYTVKHMSIVNNTATDINIKLGVGGVADANLILPNSTVVAGGEAEWSGLLVLTGAETLQAVASASGLTFTMSGLDQG